MTGATLKATLASDGLVVACFQRIAAPEITEFCAFGGFDVVIIDLEHGTISEEDVVSLVRAAEAAGIASLVRVPAGRSGAIGRLLEAGVAGIQVPLVRTATDAESAVRATRHQPDGDRGLATSRRSGYGTRLSLVDDVRTSAADVVVIVQIEDRAALGDLEAIASVDGVDAVFFGLTDLSQDMGIPGEYENPGLVRLVVEGIERAGAVGKPCGVPAATSEMASAWVSRGARYVAANDIRLVLDGVRSFTGTIRPA